MKVKKSLTEKDFSRIGRVIDLHLHLCTKGSGQDAIILMIKHQTLWFGKLEETFRTGNFMHGWQWLESPGGIGSGRSFVFSMRKDLEDRYVMRWKARRSTGRASVGKVRLNVWGFMSLAIRFLSKRIQTGLRTDKQKLLAEKLLDDWTRIFGLVDDMWEVNKWARREITLPEKMELRMREMEEAMAKGKAKSMASMRKKVKRYHQGDLRVSWVIPLLKEYCEEHGQQMHSQWTGKDWGSARNFIDYCKFSEEDPREILRGVVKNWPLFYEGAIQSSKTGKTVMFSRFVDFGEFFQYRKEIMDWLKGSSDEPSSGSPKYTIKYTDLRGKKDGEGKD